MPYEVHWGEATLLPGDYVLSFAEHVTMHANDASHPRSEEWSDLRVRARPGASDQRALALAAVLSTVEQLEVADKVKLG